MDDGEQRKKVSVCHFRHRQRSKTSDKAREDRCRRLTLRARSSHGGHRENVIPARCARYVVKGHAFCAGFNGSVEIQHDPLVQVRRVRHPFHLTHCRTGKAPACHLDFPKAGSPTPRLTLRTVDGLMTTCRVRTGLPGRCKLAASSIAPGMRHFWHSSTLRSRPPDSMAVQCAPASRASPSRRSGVTTGWSSTSAGRHLTRTCPRWAPDNGQHECHGSCAHTDQRKAWSWPSSVTTYRVAPATTGLRTAPAGKVISPARSPDTGSNRRSRPSFETRSSCPPARTGP